MNRSTNAIFCRMELDPICGTVVWPNGDLAPEALYDLIRFKTLSTVESWPSRALRRDAREINRESLVLESEGIVSRLLSLFGAGLVIADGAGARSSRSAGSRWGSRPISGT